MRKKLLTVCFVLAAVLSLMTVTASAASKSPENVKELEEAIRAAKGYDEIKLSRIFDSSAGESLFITPNWNPDTEGGDENDKLKRLTIDLNNNTLNLDSGFISVKDVALTVKNGTIKSSGTQPIVDTNSTLTVKNAVLFGKQAHSEKIIADGTPFQREGVYAVVTVDTEEAVVAHASGGVPQTGELQDVITNAEGGDIVWLRKPVEVEGNIEIKANITLELGENTITFTQYGDGAPRIGSLTIEVASPDGKEVTISGGTIEQDSKPGSTIGSAVKVTAGTVSINDTEITGKDDGVAVSGGSLTVSGTRTKINGKRSAGINVTDGGNLTVKDGEIEITGKEYGIQFAGGTLTVSGGKVSGPTALYIQSSNIENISVRGGTFTGIGKDGKSVDVAETIQGFISGGTFLKRVDEVDKKDPLLDDYLDKEVIQYENGRVGMPPDDSKNVFKVTLYANGGKFGETIDGPVKVRVVEGDTLSESDLPTPTYEGYRFEAWYLESEEEHSADAKDEKPFVFGEPIKEDGVEIHAHWRPMVNITFDPTRGELAENERTAQIEIGGTLSNLPTPTPPEGSDYTFIAWFFGDVEQCRDGETKVDTGTKFPIVDDEGGDNDKVADSTEKVAVTLHAHWGYTITFDANGGELGAGTKLTGNIDENNKATLSEFPTPTRRDYKFAGWFLDPEKEGNGRVDKKDTGYAYEVMGATKLYAHWTPRVAITLTHKITDAGAETDALTAGGSGQTITLTAVGADAKFLNDIESMTDFFVLTFDDGSEEPRQLTGFSVIPVGDDKKAVEIALNETLSKAGTLTITVKDDAFEKPPKEEAFSFSIPVIYMITFDANGGNVSPSRSRTNADGTVLLEPSDPTHGAGYVFLGWYTAATGGDEVILATKKFEGSDTVYAHWGYKITFYSNEAPSDNVSAPDEEYDWKKTGEIGAEGAEGPGTLSEWPADPTRPGYTFVKWYYIDSADGGETRTEIEKGPDGTYQPHQFTGNTKLYAVWQRSVTVIFDANGGTFDGVTGKTTYEVAVEIKENGKGQLDQAPAAPTRSEHTFNHWWSTRNESENPDDQDGPIKFPLLIEGYDLEGEPVYEKTVYAHWLENEPGAYTITFDANGGRISGKPPAGAVVSNDLKTATMVTNEKTGMLSEAPTASRDGYEFYPEWYTKPVGGDPVDFSDRVFLYDTTVYAHWGFPITFDPGFDETDADTDADEDEDAGEDETLPLETILTEEVDVAVDGVDVRQSILTRLPRPAPTRDGYKFVSWFTEKNGKGYEVTEGYVFTSAATVYAHWEEKVEYTITFDLNYETDDSQFTVKVEADKNGEGRLSSLPTVPTREGYDFKGWNTKMGGDGEEITEEYVFTGDTTVYAQWTEKTEEPEPGDDETYTITVNETANGTVTADREKAQKDETVILTINPDSGYELDKLTVTGKNSDEIKKIDDKHYSFDMPAASVTVTATFKATGGNTPGGDTPGGDNPGGDTPGGDTPGGDTPGGDTPGGDTPGGDTPGGDTPGGDTPGGDTPGTEEPDEGPDYMIQIASGSQRGKVSVSHTSAKEGTTVTVTARPDSDYSVESVEIRPVTGSSIWRYPSRDTCNFPMPASNVTIYVTFSLRPEYNNFIPPQPQTQTQAQVSAQTSLPASAFAPLEYRPAAALRDVPANSWAYPAAQWAYQNGYLDTAADGTFQLDETVSHIQLWRIMARWLGESALDDNSVTQWARRSGAYSVGAASGTMTRQNMVEYLYQCYFLMGGDVSVSGNLNQYGDNQMLTSATAKNAWLWAVNKGIISGTPEGNLNPNGVLSRAEFASILMRLYQKR